MKKRRKWVKRTILFLIAAAGIGYAVTTLMDSRKPQFTTEMVRTRDIETFYTFSGNVMADQTEIVYAASAIKINRILLNEGDMVQKEENVMRSQAGQFYESPITGVITDLYVEQNDSVKAGASLFRVASYHKPIVMISIDEYDIGAVRAGEAVKVYIQAMNKTVNGVIEKVDREATVTNNIAYYGAKVTIDPDDTILMGMTCEVSVPKQTALGVATLSLSSVKFDEDNRPFVYMRDRNDDVTAEYITLGINNGTIVEVTEGLKSGETVLIPKNNVSMFMAFQGMRFR